MLADGLGIETVGELLHHYPRRYIDRSRVATIRRAASWASTRPSSPPSRRSTKRLTRRHQSMVSITLTDGTGYLELTFFNQPWTAGHVPAGDGARGLRHRRSCTRAGCSWRTRRSRSSAATTRILVHTGRITPVHPATDGITTAHDPRAGLHVALERLPRPPDPLPDDVVRAEGLADFDEAIRADPLPRGRPTSSAAARERLKFDELFTLELGVGFRKHRVEAERTGVAHRRGGPLDRAAAARPLPFEPTDAQRGRWQRSATRWRAAAR